MSTIKVTEGHTLGADEAAKRIVAFEEMIKKYGVKTKWKGRHADLKGMGVSGSIDIFITFQFSRFNDEEIVA